MFNETHMVPLTKLSTLQKKVERLNRRAEKLGCDPITYTASEEVFLEQAPSTNGARKAKIQCRQVTLTGDVPSLNGWHFVATLVNEEGGVWIAKVPGSPEVPTRFRNEDSVGDCDHCGHNRYRTHTYIVRHEENDEWKQVGSTCLKDFVGGHEDPTRFARWAMTLAGFFAAVSDPNDPSFWGSEGLEERWETELFLSLISVAIRKRGWVSKTQAYNEGEQATADLVLFILGPRPHNRDAAQYWDEERQALEPTPEDEKLAEAALTWAEDEWLTSDVLNDYEHNMKVALLSSTVGRRTAGLVASLLPAYNREQMKAQEKADASPAPEGRQEVEVKILKLDAKQNAYGSREVMTVQNEAEGWRAWGTLPTALYGASVGDTVRIRATFEQSDDDETFAFFKRPTAL